MKNNDYLMNLDLELRHLLAERRVAEAAGECVADLKIEIMNIRRLIRAELVPAK
jgi:hypothetical protein